jgi:hypothetical protein
MIVAHAWARPLVSEAGMGFDRSEVGKSSTSDIVGECAKVESQRMSEQRVEGMEYTEDEEMAEDPMEGQLKEEPEVERKVKVDKIWAANQELRRELGLDQMGAHRGGVKRDRRRSTIPKKKQDKNSKPEEATSKNEFIEGVDRASIVIYPSDRIRFHIAIDLPDGDSMDI